MLAYCFVTAGALSMASFWSLYLGIVPLPAPERSLYDALGPTDIIRRIVTWTLTFVVAGLLLKRSTFALWALVSFLVWALLPIAINLVRNGSLGLSATGAPVDRLFTLGVLAAAIVYASRLRRLGVLT